MDLHLLVPAAGAAVLTWWVASASRAGPGPWPANPRLARRAHARATAWGAWWRELEWLGLRLGGSAPASLDERLVLGGRPAGMSADEWAAALRALTLVCYLGAALLAALIVAGVLPAPAWAGVPAIATLPAAPGMVLDLWGRTRVATLEARLPDLAERLALGILAGLPVRQAFADAVRTEVISGRTPPWLVRELSLVARILELSCADLACGLDRLHASIPSTELKLLIGQLSVAQDSGGSTVFALRAFARARRRAFATDRSRRVGSAHAITNLVGLLPVGTLMGIVLLYALQIVATNVNPSMVSP